MSEDWLKLDDALEYLRANGYEWSRKTLQNRSSGQFAAIRKIRRGSSTFFRKADLDAFIRADTRTTLATGLTR